MDWVSRIVGHEKVAAGQLLANPFNHRQHPKAQRDVVAASIEELGFVKSVIVNRTTGHIVDGHERVMQALGVGEETMVDVEYVSLTLDEERKALLILDASSEMAKVDADLLRELVNVTEFNLPALDGLMQDMMASAGVKVTIPPGDDDLPEPPDEPIARLGDLWILGDHRVICGDCTDSGVVSRLLNGVMPVLMVTDPPYGVEYDPSWRNEAGLGSTERTGVVLNDDRADWTEAWLLFPGPVAYVWHGALHASEVEQSLVKASFEVRSQIIWAKPRAAISRGAYHWGHEPALVASRGEQSIEPDESTDQDGEHGWYCVRKGAKAYWCGGRKQSTVWNIGFAGEVKSEHGTQKPVACMARPMMNHGRPGDVVYDPFLGSGTSVIAAMRSKRVCYGCELNPAYVDLIVRRWQNITGLQAQVVRQTEEVEA
jgi:hypothetical protein